MRFIETHKCDIIEMHEVNKQNVINVRTFTAENNEDRGYRIRIENVLMFLSS